jgi:hypothetical protein
VREVLGSRLRAEEDGGPEKDPAALKSKYIAMLTSKDLEIKNLKMQLKAATAFNGGGGEDARGRRDER